MITLLSYSAIMLINHIKIRNNRLHVVTLLRLLILFAAIWKESLIN